LLELARKDPQQHAEEAGEQIRQAIAVRPGEAGRSNALDRIGLAEVYFLIGDLESACRETHGAVDAASVVQSARVREGLADLYAYAIGHGQSARVREARARIREQLTD
jgi:hypothetical protein